MSATINENAAKSVSNQEGEIGSHVPRTGPETTHGHQPGRQVGNDALPESKIETLPAGSAPADRTFQPQNDSDIPSQAAEDAKKE